MGIGFFNNGGGSWGTRPAGNLGHDYYYNPDGTIAFTDYNDPNNHTHTILNLPTATVMGQKPTVWQILGKNRFSHWQPMGTGGGLSVNPHFPQYSEFAEGVKDITFDMFKTTAYTLTGEQLALGGYKLGGKAWGYWKGLRAAKANSQGFKSFSAFKRAMGPAGNGQAWHHIVEQGGTNVAKFGANRIHNTSNLIKLPHGKGSIHARISGYYSSKQPFTGGQTVRQWLSTQSYQQQYDFGIRTLRQFGWTP